MRELAQAEGVGEGVEGRGEANSALSPASKGEADATGEWSLSNVLSTSLSLGDAVENEKAGPLPGWSRDARRGGQSLTSHGKSLDFL